MKKFWPLKETHYYKHIKYANSFIISLTNNSFKIYHESNSNSKNII